MTTPVQHLTVRVPEELRDHDGVRLDAMLSGEGMVLIRELPRVGAPLGYVDLLVEDTSAPAAVRGHVVALVCDEHDGELSFDRWEPWDGPTAARGEPHGLRSPALATGLEQLSDAELEEILDRRRAAKEAAAG
jgi:hypothetical protein